MENYIDLHVVRKIVGLHEIDVFPYSRCIHELINQMYKAADLGLSNCGAHQHFEKKINHAEKVLPLSINRRAIFK